jgi:hypothetical protein
LNVLQAAEVISRDGKLLTWIGNNVHKNICGSGEASKMKLQALLKKKAELQNRLQEKREEAVNLNQHYASFKWLVDRNIARVLNGSSRIDVSETLHVPFVLVSSNIGSIECQVRYQMNFIDDSNSLNLDFLK